jgi:type II secretory pathway component GspD/PulD (secretin)
MAYIMDVCKSFVVGGRWSTDRPASAGASVAVQSGSARPASEVIPAQGSAGAQTIKDADVIVYEGSSSEIQRLRKLIAQIDIPPPQVVIQATLYEVSNIAKDASAVGIAGEILGGRLGVNLGSVAAGPWSFGASIGGVSGFLGPLVGYTIQGIGASESPPFIWRKGSGIGRG